MTTTSFTPQPIHPEASPELRAAIERSVERVQDVLDAYKVEHVAGLYSGGNDSTTFMHLLGSLGIVDEVVHVDTGIGIPATQEFVVASCAHLGLPLRIVRTPREEDQYDALVEKHGFPGPGGHAMMYRRLKERALDSYRRQVKESKQLKVSRRKGDPDRIVFLAGMRWEESQRRMLNAEEVDEDGAVVWVSPIVHWTKTLMLEYRRLHECRQDHAHALHKLCAPGVIGRNWVSDLIHMSGECLCGAFAHEGEFEELQQWFPEVAERIAALQDVAAAAGQRACIWGKRPPRRGKGEPVSNASDARALEEAKAKLGAASARLCTKCVVEPTWDDVQAMLDGSSRA